MSALTRKLCSITYRVAGREPSSTSTCSPSRSAEFQQPDLVGLAMARTRPCQSRKRCTAASGTRRATSLLGDRDPAPHRQPRAPAPSAFGARRATRLWLRRHRPPAGSARPPTRHAHRRRCAPSRTGWPARTRAASAPNTRGRPHTADRSATTNSGASPASVADFRRARHHRAGDRAGDGVTRQAGVAVDQRQHAPRGDCVTDRRARFAHHAGEARDHARLPAGQHGHVALRAHRFHQRPARDRGHADPGLVGQFARDRGAAFEAVVGPAQALAVEGRVDRDLEAVRFVNDVAADESVAARRQPVLVDLPTEAGQAHLHRGLDRIDRLLAAVHPGRVARRGAGFLDLQLQRVVAFAQQAAAVRAFRGFLDLLVVAVALVVVRVVVGVVVAGPAAGAQREGGRESGQQAGCAKNRNHGDSPLARALSSHGSAVRRCSSTRARCAAVRASRMAIRVAVTSACTAAHSRYASAPAR